MLNNIEEPNYENNKLKVEHLYDGIGLETTEQRANGGIEYIFNLTNDNDLDLNLTMMLKRKNSFGEIVFISENILIKSKTTSEFYYSPDFESLKLENGELIYFEFVTQENTLYPAYYKSYVNYIKKDKTENKNILALIEKVKVARAFI